MFDISRQIKQSLRSLFRSPGFTLPIVLILGLGLGVNVALHAILQAVQHRSLPVPDRGRLVLVRTKPKGENELWNISHPQFEDLKAAVQPMVDASEAVVDSSTQLHHEGRVSDVNVPMVGAGWFQAMGLKPQLGRLFAPDEEAAGAPVALISDRLWRTRFHGDPGIVGRSVNLGGAQVNVVTIVGVAPQGFQGLEAASREDLWMPLKAINRIMDGLPPGFFTDRRMPAFLMLARLRPGVSMKSFQAALDAAGANMAQASREASLTNAFVAQGLDASEQKLLQQVLPQRTLLVIAAAMALVLATVATSGLFAARAARREVELTTRQALGAGGADLVRPMILEALLLALMACPVALASGLFLARRFMLKPGQAATEAWLLPGLDGRVLALGLGLSLGALLLAALVPLLKLRRLEASRILIGQGGRSGAKAGGGIFVVAQVALSLLLLAASSLALNAFRGAARMGYPTTHRAMMIVDCANDPGLPDRLLARLRETPGLRSVAKSAAAPLGGMRITFGLKGGDRTTMDHFPAAMVGAGWFRTLGVPVLAGREFGERDGKNVVILNESLAKRFFPGRSAVGQHIDMGGDQPLEVIGVVADHRMRPDPEFHLPMIWLSTDFIHTNQFCVMAEGKGGAQGLLDPLRAALQAEKSGAEPIQLLTLGDHIAATLHRENQNLRLLGSLGLGSLVLACFGLWAALNLQMTLRRRELGIRAALGATAWHLLQTILTKGLKLLGAGIVAGIALLILMATGLSQRWPSLPQPHWMDCLWAALAMVMAGLLACLIPALRASRSDPAGLLRSE